MRVLFLIVVSFFLFSCNTKNKDKLVQANSYFEQIDTISDSTYVSVKKNLKKPKENSGNKDPNEDSNNNADDIKILDEVTTISDMRIVMKGPDGTINMFFDADNYGLKIQVLSENQTMYADEQGFAYFNSPEEGWLKTNMSQMFGAMAKMVPIDLGFVPFQSKKGTVFHKIAAFAAEVTISKLEKEPRAKKISGGIGTEKTVFIADDRVTVTFDSFKRLESIIEGSSGIKYYYEAQQITFPNAKVMAMPSFK